MVAEIKLVSAEISNSVSSSGCALPNADVGVQLERELNGDKEKFLA